MIDPTSSPVRRRLLSWARQYGWKHWDPRKRESVGPRDTLWFAIALLLSDDRSQNELGHCLLGTASLADATHTPATLLAVLNSLPGRLSPATSQHLEHLIAQALPAAASYYWHDGNVNHPLAAWCTLILGGDRADNGLAIDLGVDRLNHLRRTIGDRRHTFHRQSTFSEYNSPTYTALNLWFLALTAEYAQRTDAREIAHFLEERLWMEIALHFHAPSQQFSGPHSRAYLEDSLGGFSGLHCTLAAGLDDLIFLDPTIADEIGHASALIQNALVAIIPFHLPDQARELALRKPLPSLVRLTTYGESYHENSASSGFDDDVFPGGWSELTSYQSAEFALGTATRPYINAGHAEAFVARIRRKEAVHALTDFRSIVCRGVFNDAQPGQPNRVHVTGGRTDATYLYEEGRTAVMQHENRALVLYTPKGSRRRPFTAFRVELIIAPSIPFDRLYAAGHSIDSLPVDLIDGTRITFRDFKTYGVIVPLSPTPLAGPNPITIHEINGCLIISISNHQGPPIDPPPDEFLQWRNGFYCELWPRDAFRDFSAFQLHVEAIRIDEERPPSGERRVVMHSGADTLHFVHDPRSERIFEQTVNKRDNRVSHFQAIALESGKPLISEGTLYGQEAWNAHAHPPIG
jgi:hypothetical protein